MTPDEFRAAREALGLTQEDMAIALGLAHRNSVMRRETGIVKVRPLEETAIRRMLARKRRHEAQKGG